MIPEGILKTRRSQAQDESDRDMKEPPQFTEQGGVMRAPLMGESGGIGFTGTSRKETSTSEEEWNGCFQKRNLPRRGVVRDVRRCEPLSRRRLIELEDVGGPPELDEQYRDYGQYAIYIIWGFRQPSIVQIRKRR